MNTAPRHVPSPPFDLTIRSITGQLSPQARRARMRIIGDILKRRSPCNIHAASCPASAQEVEELVARKAMVLDRSGNIDFIYPVSALPTLHRVTLADVRCFSAMCAIDALGSTFAFDQAVTIESKCSTCQTPVRLDLDTESLQRVDPGSVHVLHMDLRRMNNWAASC